MYRLSDESEAIKLDLGNLSNAHDFNVNKQPVSPGQYLERSWLCVDLEKNEGAAAVMFMIIIPTSRSVWGGKLWEETVEWKCASMSDVARILGRATLSDAVEVFK